MKLILNEKSVIQIWISFWLFLFLVAGLSGLTTSSISFVSSSASNSVSSSDSTFGDPRSIRSDEYLRASPWDIGLLSSGSAEFATPLANSNNSLVYPDPDSFIDSLNAIDTLWPRYLPFLSIQQEFAFSWWTPILLALVFLPLFLREMGTTSLVSIAVTTLIVASSVNVWWSMWISPIIGYSSLAAYIFLFRLSRWQNKKSLLFVTAFVAGFSVFKLLTCYQPWVIVIAPAILVPAIVRACQNSGAKKSFKDLSVIVAAFSALTAAFLIQNSGALTTFQNTLYPGQRRSVGELVNLAITWGAPHLQILNLSPEIINTNASELSSSFSVLFFAGAAIAIMNRGSFRNSYVALSASLVSLVWLCWISFPLPNVFGGIPVLSLVTPTRAASVFGILAALFFAYSTIGTRGDKANTPMHWQIPIMFISASLAGIMTYVAGNDLALNVPRLGPIRIAVASLLMFFIVLTLVSKSLQKIGLVLIVCFSIAISLGVNPVQKSLNGIANGDVIDRVKSQNNETSLWASDSNVVDALLMANSIHSLSGQQLIGPNPEVWKVLDPAGASESSWNRGASYVVFSWSGNEIPKISTPHGDVIQVMVEPCALSERIANLDYIISNNELNNSCLIKVDEFVQFGQLNTIYKIE